MDVSWSAFDGALGILLVIVIIWVALKLVKRIVIGLIIIALVAAAFFTLHYGELPFGGG